MPCCSALGCSIRKNDKTVYPPISLHQFPSDEEEKQKWILAVNRQGWIPSRRSYLCSKHFTEDCFDRSEFYSKLNKGAVPSIFNFHPRSLKVEEIKPPIQEPEPPSADESLPPLLPLPPPPKKVKPNPKNTAEELLGMAAEFFNSPESESEVLAKGWAIKLSKLAPDQRLFAEKIINDTLFEAQLGTLTRNGVRFLGGSQFNSH